MRRPHRNHTGVPATSGYDHFQTPGATLLDDHILFSGYNNCQAFCQKFLTTCQKFLTYGRIYMAMISGIIERITREKRAYIVHWHRVGSMEK